MIKMLFNKKNNSGLSIIEVLVVIFILTVIGVAVAKFQIDIFSFSTSLSNTLVAQQEVRQAFKMMSGEIRSLSVSSIGSYPIAEADSTSFTFYSDIDDDGLKERIRYFLDGNILKKGTIKPTGSPLIYNPANEKVTEVVHYIANSGIPIFDYYDAYYDGTTLPIPLPVNLSEVRLVKITIFTDRDPSRSPAPLSMTTHVSMRNLKDNL